MKDNDLIPVIRTGMNYLLGEFPNDMESPSSESLTIPGMSTPLDELLNRMIRGREIPVMNEPIYDGHLNLPDVRTMDKVEKEVFRRKVRSQIADYRTRLQEAESRKTAADQQAQLDRIASLEAQIASQPSGVDPSASEL